MSAQVKVWLLCLSLLWGALATPPAQAAEALPAPSGPVILTVSGAIDATNAPGEARFDRAMLEALGLSTLKTSTVWTDGVKAFEGVPLRKILERVGAKPQRIVASAANEYRAVIPADDFTFDLHVAMRMDGEVLTLRNKGPLWIVYPRDTHKALRDDRYDQRWVWQLTHIRVE